VERVLGQCGSDCLRKSSLNIQNRKKFLSCPRDKMT
jgi:hypothetical protein